MLTLIPSLCGNHATVWYSAVGAWLVNTSRWGTMCPSTTRWSTNSFLIVPLELTRVSRDDWIPCENPLLYLSWSYLCIYFKKRQKIWVRTDVITHWMQIINVILNCLPTKLNRSIKSSIYRDKKCMCSSHTEHPHSVVYVSSLFG